MSSPFVKGVTLNAAHPLRSMKTAITLLNRRMTVSSFKAGANHGVTPHVQDIPHSGESRG
jgi:hypothetical protein